MGAQLVVYFDKAKAKGGLQAQIKLAMITKMSSQVAASAPDSPENIKMFEDAISVKDPKRTVRAADIAEVVAEGLEA